MQALLSWIVPFFFSFFFFDRSGNLRVPIANFKTAMYATFSAVGAGILKRALCALPAQGEPVLPTAVGVGAFFACVNCLLDILILIPFMNAAQTGKEGFKKVTVRSWFSQIGAGYIAIVAQAWLAGAVADWAVAEAKGNL